MEKIGVCLRLRPMNEKEQKEKEIKAWRVVGEKQVELNGQAMKELGMNKFCSYDFKRCFQEDEDNLTLFEESVKEIVLSCLEGINSTVFMYGQTGAGKTFTMLGGKKQDL